MVDDIQEGEIAALDVYDNCGNELIKKGAILKASLKTSLKKAGIYFLYSDDNEGSVHTVYKLKTLAELLQVMKCFIASNGENAEILKKYGKEEIKRFLSASNETGNKIAYGHIFRYFATEMVSSLNENKKQVYDFQEYRTIETYPEYHIVNAACITGVLAHNMGLKDEEKVDAITGALLCDIKMNQYKFIGENRELTGTEKEEMRQHPLLSFDMARKIYGIPARAALIALQHHERYDKGGYPKGIGGNDIGVLGKIAAIADVYDALTSSRPFRKVYTPSDAWHCIDSNIGILFDPAVAEEFKRSIPEYFPGDIVEVKDGDKAIVLENCYGKPQSPSIKIIEKKDKSAIISCSVKTQTIVKTLESIRQKEQQWEE